MALLKFLKGNYSSLSTAAIAEGQILICGDTGEMFVDVAADKRVKIGDYVTVASLEALMAIDATSVPTSRLYYVEGANILARSNGTSWDQINKDTGATSIEVVGEGNAVTAASYDATTRKLTLTKGATFATKAELDTLDTFVGDIPEGYTETNVIAYINKKAEETLNAASGGSSESAASVLAALNSYKAENDPKVQANTEAAAAAQKAADDAQSDVDTLAETHATDKKALEDAIALKANAADVYTKDDIDGKVDTINEAIEAKANAADVYTQTQVDGMVDDLEAADLAINNKIGTVAKGKTVVEMIADAQSAATYDDSEVRGLIDTNAEAIAKEIEDREGAVSGLKTELEGKIDTKVEQEAYDTKVAALEAKDAELAGLVSAETTAREEADNALDERLVKVEAFFEGAAEDGEGLQNALDTLVEIQEYIDTHGEAASAMVDNIAANAKAIEDEAERADEAEKALGGRIDDLSGVVDTKAAASDLTALGERVTAEEGKVTTLQTEMDAVEQKAADNAAAIEALQTASANYALDADLDAAVERVAANETAIEALQTASATYATTDALNAHIDDAVKHITAEERAAWNKAISDLADHKTAYEAKVAELVAEDADIRSDFAAADAALKTEMEAYADQAELDAVSAAKTETESQVGAAKTEMQGKIDTVAGDLAAYETANDAAVALKADASTVYTKAEVEDLMSWGSF